MEYNGKKISGICFDSRLVKPSDLFVAQVGTQVDGRTFIPSALEKGAVDAVVDEDGTLLGTLASEFYDFPSRHLTLVGVTGTNGKTTIATLLYNMAMSLGHRAGLISTVVYKVGEREYPSTHTTPDAVTLNRLMAEMVADGCEYCFMEVSSHSIDQHRIAGLDFDGAIFTNLTRDHIDYHGSMEAYRDCKKRLFDGLKREAFAVTNADDRNGLVMTQNTKARVLTYSTQRMADHRAHILEEGFDGMLLSLDNREVFVSMVGRFNASNLLAIYSTALQLWPSVEPQELLRVLSTLHAVNGRFETLRSPKGWTAIIDYAHTPDAVENVLRTIHEILDARGAGRVITVVGCGGNRDRGKRPMMAHIARTLSDVLILTSDNPRDEDPEEILREMATGLTDDERLKTLILSDRESAIQTACTMARENDVILVAGKGHEDYQIILGVKHHFDDHEVVKKYL